MCRTSRIVAASMVSVLVATAVLAQAGGGGGSRGPSRGEALSPAELTEAMKRKFHDATAKAAIAKQRAIDAEKQALFEAASQRAAAAALGYGFPSVNRALPGLVFAVPPADVDAAQVAALVEDMEIMSQVLGKAVAEALGVIPVSMNDGVAKFTVESGSYVFTAPWK